MPRGIAITIENPWRLREYKTLCNKNGICVSVPVSKNTVYPHWQMLLKVGNTVYSLYNDTLEGTPTALIEMNYAPYTYFASEKLIKDFINKKGDSENESTDKD